MPSANSVYNRNLAVPCNSRYVSLMHPIAPVIWRDPSLESRCFARWITVASHSRARWCNKGLEAQAASARAERIFFSRIGDSGVGQLVGTRLLRCHRTDRGSRYRLPHCSLHWRVPDSVVLAAYVLHSRAIVSCRFIARQLSGAGLVVQRRLCTSALAGANEFRECDG